MRQAASQCSYIACEDRYEEPMGFPAGISSPLHQRESSASECALLHA